MNLLIYGARSLALGAYRVVQTFEPTCHVVCFLVSSLENNPSHLAGLQVEEIGIFASNLQDSEKEKFHILVAAPEDQHPGIIEEIRKRGFCRYSCMDSQKESQWMEEYFARQGQFPSLHRLGAAGMAAKPYVVMARHYKDRKLKNPRELPRWIHPLQVGAALTDVRVGVNVDHIGENISEKNGNYSELTALYWMWKNKLERSDSQDHAEYYGLVHYRRILDIRDDDLFRLRANHVDVVLPFPTVHEPNILEHHRRYISESDWDAMLQAFSELYPHEIKLAYEIFDQPFFLNYNIILARKQVLKDYCRWLFPILKRTEELSDPKGWERNDRYIGYLSENLMTLYFLSRQKELNIYYTGRLMFT